MYDGEFLFFANDEVCNVRVGSRGGGGREWKGSQPALFSYTTVRKGSSGDAMMPHTRALFPARRPA